MIWESSTGRWWRAKWRAFFDRKWTDEDRVLAIVLGLGGAGIGLGLVAVSLFM